MFLDVPGLEVDVEEVNDPPPRVTGRRLVIAGAASFAIALTQSGSSAGVVVVEKAVSRVGVHLDMRSSGG
jgi:hypothetical protein